MSNFRSFFDSLPIAMALSQYREKLGFFMAFEYFRLEERAQEDAIRIRPPLQLLPVPE